MEKKHSSKIATDYNPLGTEKDIDQARSKEQQQQDRLQEDQDDKRPAGDAGPEDAPETTGKGNDPPY